MVLSLLCAQLVSAASVTAVGRSALDKDIDLARQSALDDAIKNALLTHGGQVDSHTSVHDSLLSEDRIRFRAAGQVRNVHIIAEYKDHPFYVVEISAEVEARGSCVDQESHGYSRSVLFTAFPREEWQSSLLGKLGNVDADLPLEMSRRLYPQHLTLVQTDKEADLNSHSQYLSHSRLTSDEIQDIARKYSAQFVISGSVLDMSMIYPEDYFRRTYGGGAANQIGSKVRRWFGKPSRDIRDRAFALRLVLSDGLSGQPLFDKVYKTEGAWDAPYTADTGFGSPSFWRTAYGQSVSELMDQAVADLGQKLSCQPFMVSAKALPEDHSMYVPVGTNHGIQVGDSFAIYLQHAVEAPGYEASPTGRFKDGASLRMRSENKTFTVTETYPTYSVGRTSEAVTVGKRYLVVAW